MDRSAWFERRRGRITGSRVALLTEGSASSWARLLATLKRERDAGPGGWMDGTPETENSPPDMRRGHELEPKAVALFELVKGVDTEEAGEDGFVTHPAYPNDVGASPDRICLDLDAVIEIKAPRMKGHMQAWTYGMPRQHIPQVQHEIFCTRHLGISCCYFVSFCEEVEPTRQLYIERIPMDQSYQDRISRSIERFLPELYGQRPAEKGDIPNFF